MKRNLVTLTMLGCITIIGFTSGRALAATPPDVLGDPLGFADRVSALWRSGAIPGALILAAFGVLVVLRAKVAWFREGHRAVYVAALIGGLGFLVDAMASGATPNLSMIMIAASTTVALALNPKHQDPQAPTPPSSSTASIPTATVVKDGAS